MLAHCQELRKLEGKFDDLELSHVLHHDNEAVDALAKMGSSWEVYYLESSSSTCTCPLSKQSQPRVQ